MIKTLQDARMRAAQAWCHPNCHNKCMDVTLAEAFADILFEEVQRGTANETKRSEETGPTGEGSGTA